MQRGPDGPVKIGRAVDPQQRMRAHQTSNAEPLSLLLVIAGTAERERAIHTALVASHMSGEWYHPTSEIFAFIDRMREPEFEVHGARAFAVLRRKDASTPTSPCPFCGERHVHGEGDGHRNPHCVRITHAEVTTPAGITIRQRDGYYIRSHSTQGPLNASGKGRTK
jgi:hypothetical protein